MTIHLNIGSNLGDRPALISRAVALLREAFPEGHFRVSEPVESEPWGFVSENTFVNVGVAIDVDGDVDPEKVLGITQGVEKAISPASHRKPDGTYADRLVDVDIIAIDPAPGRTLEYQSPTLVLPHPRARLRAFVLAPLRSLCPGHPLLK